MISSRTSLLLQRKGQACCAVAGELRGGLRCFPSCLTWSRSGSMDVSWKNPAPGLPGASLSHFSCCSLSSPFSQPVTLAALSAQCLAPGLCPNLAGSFCMMAFEVCLSYSSKELRPSPHLSSWHFSFSTTSISLGLAAIPALLYLRSPSLHSDVALCPSPSR